MFRLQETSRTPDLLRQRWGNRHELVNSGYSVRPEALCSACRKKESNNREITRDMCMVGTQKQILYVLNAKMLAYSHEIQLARDHDATMGITGMKHASLLHLLRLSPAAPVSCCCHCCWEPSPSFQRSSYPSSFPPHAASSTPSQA